MSEAEAGNKDNHRDCDLQWTEARFLPICEVKKNIAGGLAHGVILQVI